MKSNHHLLRMDCRRVDLAPHKRVAEALALIGAPHQVLRHQDLSDHIESPLDFANALGISLGSVTKSVLFREVSPASRFVLAVLPMPSRIDFKLLAQAIDARKLTLASREELDSVLGYPPSGVSPFGVTNAIVVIEDLLLSCSTVTVGGGEVGIEIEVDPAILRELPGVILAHFTT